MTADRDLPGAGGGDDGGLPETEALVAEYVLGTLPAGERAYVADRIRRDSDVAALVEAWQERFAPLNAEFPEVTPPAALLPRIEARIFGTNPRPGRNWWPSVLGGSLAGLAVAGVAGFLVLSPLSPISVGPDGTVQTPERQTLARLTGEGQALVVTAQRDPASGQLVLTRAEGPAAPDGRDYEAWVIAPGSAPVSAGLLREGDLVLPAELLAAGVTLAITLEPEGGAPGTDPTGPLLVAAELQTL